MATKIRVEYLSTDSITPSDDNPRRHPRSQIRQLTKAIRKLGFINPIIVDQDGIIVAGHARHQVAIEMGLEQVPTIMVDHLNKHQLRLYRLADNKLCENGEWDPELLAVDLKLLIEHEFDMEEDGYTATRHQREVGAGYFDQVATVITGGAASTLAMHGSTEEEQF